MSEQVCTQIVDLNKKPEPKPQTTALVVTPPTPIEQPEVKVNETMPILDKPEKVNTIADAYFITTDPVLLKNLFETIHALVDEITFQFESDRLLIRAMDPSRVALLDYCIVKEHFEEWEVSKPGYATFNIEEVLKVVFSAIKKDTRVKVAVNSKEAKMVFTLSDSRTRTREFPLLCTDEVPEMPPKPLIQFDAQFTVASKQWQDDLKDMAKTSDHVKINVEPEGVTVEAEGDLVKSENKYKRGCDILLDIQVQQSAHAKFSLSYLATGFNFFEPKLCDVAVIDMKTDFPIRATLRTPFGDLYHYLAPRIET